MVFMRISRVLLVCVAALMCGEASQSQTASTNVPATPSQAVPEHPITIEQLRTFMQELNLVEATQTLTMEEAERQRKTLPPWFPSDVWDAVEKKIAAIDLAKVELPVYQRHISEENADAMILFLQGPLGAQIAERILPRRMAVARTGASGSEAEGQTVAQTSQDDVDLGTKRLNELSPADRQRVVQAREAIMSSWQATSDELAALYDSYVNDLVQKEIAAHNRELAAAQQAYGQKSHSSSSPQH